MIKACIGPNISRRIPYKYRKCYLVAEIDTFVAVASVTIIASITIKGVTNWFVIILNCFNMETEKAKKRQLPK